LWIWALKKRHVAWALAGSIYFAGFATTANILMPTGTIMGERLAYLPSAGFCLLAALAWDWLRQKKNNLAWGILITIVLIFSVRTAARNRDWKDSLALYSSSVRTAPNSAKIHANLANAYLLSNQLDLSDAQFQAALRIYPYSPEMLSAYSNLEVKRGNYEDALDKMRKAMSMSGRNHLDYDSMVVSFAAILMKTNHTDEALENLNREISESPQYSPAWSARAVLHFGRGDLNDAQSDAQSALRVDSTNIMAVRVLQRISTPVSTESKK
jgi:tetratricopeptide (TPR) repeat protein